ncbi:uncharacterized protein BCR38DRAFT_413218 [Pseudomassariella vexata]|uniref:GH64 domain-containing protein n=1 Tax=Pseudomassariella vexata TaxID=1141098 RepID=A0A1Y2DI36_9PEZI|nr:uncharacterized protein BCR38DRAFT_413218 [Pseudomassariella vexata]ORY58899.1 hypothetical protein BCR38DRAFT_413218 [Pseudomassariella vexata]
MAVVAVTATPLKLSLKNKLGGQLNAYVTGQDTAGDVVMLAPDGSWYHPDAGGSTSPVQINAANVTLPLTGDVTELTIPDFISAGRIWVAVGELQFFTLVEPSAVNPDDPSADVNWGFVELTNTEKSGIYANISFVDWVGLLLGMSLTLGSGEVQTVEGLAKNAVSSICNDMKTQAADGQPWDKMCVSDASDYTDYANKVWDQYTNQDLVFDTQNAGNTTCRANGDQLTCTNDNRAYARPTVGDIWGCNSGPFAMTQDDNDIHKAVVPRLCAAFQRSTLLLDGGDVQPSSAVGKDTYYKETPTNHYSRIVHNYLVGGRGYAFAYDDVNPDGENAAGVVSGPSPQELAITIGGA